MCKSAIIQLLVEEVEELNMHHHKKRRLDQVIDGNMLSWPKQEGNGVVVGGIGNLVQSCAFMSRRAAENRWLKSRERSVLFDI